MRVTVLLSVIVVTVLIGAVTLERALAQKGSKMMSMPTMAEQNAMLKKSIAAGMKLFSDKSLGTNNTSCASCHPGGGTVGGKVTAMGMQMPIPSLKGAAATFPKWKMGARKVITLAQMNNGCLQMFMKGKPLSINDQRMADLAAYVTSLSKGRPVYSQLK